MTRKLLVFFPEGSASFSQNWYAPAFGRSKKDINHLAENYSVATLAELFDEIFKSKGIKITKHNAIDDFGYQALPYYLSFSSKEENVEIISATLYRGDTAYQLEQNLDFEIQDKDTIVFAKVLGA